jgi:hypothetical protein
VCALQEKERKYFLKDEEAWRPWKREICGRLWIDSKGLVVSSMETDAPTMQWKPIN